MYYGGGSKTQHNPDSQSLPFQFVTAYLRGGSQGFTLKGGDATKGLLATQYDGPRPDPKIAGTCGKTGTYQPMRKQGAIILATGGDFSNSAMGKFCECRTQTLRPHDNCESTLRGTLSFNANYRFTRVC